MLNKTTERAGWHTPHSPTDRVPRLGHLPDRDATRLVVGLDADGALSAPERASLARLESRRLLLERRWSRADVDEVTYVGVARLDDRPVLVPGLYAGDAWLILPLNQDPLWMRGDYPMPPAEFERLHLLARLAQPDELQCYVAHQIPRAWQDRVRRSMAADEPVPYAALAPQPARSSNRWGVVASQMAIAATVGFVLIAGILDALASTATTIDPIVLGALAMDEQPERGDLAAFYALAHWDWRVAGPPRA